MTDLRLPLIASLGVAVTAAALTGLPAALALLAGAVVLAWHRGVDGRQALHRLMHIEGFLILLLLWLPFTVPGRPLLQVGPLVASAEGAGLALLIAVKVNAVALVVLALLGRAGADDLGRALLALGVPERFVRLLSLLARHIPTARDGLHRQSEAMRARGFRPGTSLHAWRSYGHLMGGALLRAMDRAQRVDEAMRLRGGGRMVLGALPGLSFWRFALPGVALAVLVALDRLA